jgi:hypothetical protein
VVIENKKPGRAWYVPLCYEPRDDLLGAAIRCQAGENERGQLRPLIYTISDPAGGPFKNV